MYDHAYSQDGATPPAPDPAQQIADTRLAVREMLALAADRVGGVDKLEKWLRYKENERIFWSVMLPRLLPREAGGEAGMDAQITAMVATWLPPQ